MSAPAHVEPTVRDTSHRCCCGRLHVKTGTQAVAAISAFFIVTNLVAKIAGYSETAWDWELVFLVVDTIAVASLFHALRSAHAAFIQPFVVLSIITISFLGLLATSMVCAAYDPDSYSGQDLELELHKRLSQAAQHLQMKLKSMISIVALVCLVFIILSVAVHCTFVVWAVRCARYFRHTEHHKIKSETIAL